MPPTDNAASITSSDAVSSLKIREYRELISRLRTILLVLPLCGAFLGWGIWYALRTAGQPTDEQNLVWAVRGNDLATVKSLLEQGVSPDATEDPAPVPALLRLFGVKPQSGSTAGWERGKTALMWAVSSYPQHPAMVKALLDHGADVNRRSTYGRTTLLMAMDQGDMSKQETIDLLLVHKANVNTAGDNGDTPLLIAVRGDRLQSVPLLLDHGARVDLTTPQGKRILALAIQRRNRQIINMLKRAGAQATSSVTDNKSVTHDRAK